MQLKMFSVSALAPGEGAEEMNRFLRAHRVLSLEKRLVGLDAAAYWAVCIQYLERSVVGSRAGGLENPRSKVDYKEVLNEEDFAVFARLRELRKTLAEKEAVPPYAVFTNEQLAAMVTQKSDSLTALGQVEGVGASRLEKYGPAFLEFLKKEPEAVVTL